MNIDSAHRAAGSAARLIGIANRQRSRLVDLVRTAAIQIIIKDQEIN